MGSTPDGHHTGPGSTIRPADRGRVYSGAVTPPLDTGTGQSARHAIPRVWREGGFWCLVVSTVLSFFPSLFLGRTLYFRDIYLFYLPMKAYFASLVKGGDGPFWLPLLNGGQPMWSNPVHHVLYPANLLYLVLEPLTAFSTDIVIHIALAAVGTYFLGRVLGLSPSASALAAATFAFSGYMLSLVNLLNRLYSFAPAPLLLAFWHLYWRDRRARWCIAAAAVEAAQWFSGGAEFALISVGFVTMWILVHPYASTTRCQRLVSHMLLQVLIAGVLAVQLIPAIPFIKDSARAGGLPYEAFSSWSLHPTRLPELLVPGFFGRVDTLDETEYWGRHRVSNGFPYIVSLYIGVLPISLALFAAASGGRHVLPRGPRILLGLLTCGGIALALGGSLPGFRLLYENVPFVSTFRYPIKFLAMAMLPVALLAGTAVHRAFEDSDESRQYARRVGAWSALFGIPVVAGLVTLIAFPTAALRVEEHLFLTSSSTVTRGLVAAFGRASAVWSVGCLVMVHRCARQRPWQSPFLAALVVVDLLTAGIAVNPTASRGMLENVPAVVKTIRDSGEEGRLFRDPVPAGVILRAPTNDPVHQYRWNLEVLNFYLCWTYGIPTVYHADYDLLAANHVRSLTELVHQLPWSRRIPLLSAAGVRWVISHRRLQQPQLEMIATIPNSSNLDFYLYLNRAAPAFATFVTSFRNAASHGEALGLMLDPGFDPRVTTILEGVDTEASIPTQRRPDAVLSDEAEQLTVIQRSADSWSAVLRNPVDGFLVFAETYNSGWRVLIDGRRAPLLRANGAFSAVFVPAGEHEIERRYSPPGLAVGAAISLLSVALLVVAAFRISPRVVSSAPS